MLLKTSRGHIQILVQFCYVFRHEFGTASNEHKVHVPIDSNYSKNHRNLLVRVESIGTELVLSFLGNEMDVSHCEFFQLSILSSIIAHHGGYQM
jgi:hypothetical protein